MDRLPDATFVDPEFGLVGRRGDVGAPGAGRVGRRHRGRPRRPPPVRRRARGRRRGRPRHDLRRRHPDHRRGHRRRDHRRRGPPLRRALPGPRRAVRRPALEHRRVGGPGRGAGVLRAQLRHPSLRRRPRLGGRGLALAGGAGGPGRAGGPSSPAVAPTGPTRPGSRRRTPSASTRPSRSTPPTTCCRTPSDPDPLDPQVVVFEVPETRETGQMDVRTRLEGELVDDRQGGATGRGPGRKGAKAPRTARALVVQGAFV